VQDSDGVFVFLGDMPLVPAHIAPRLADALADRFSVVPVFDGKQGHPVLLSARAAALAATLSGDQGAGALLRAHEAEVARLEADDEGVLLDVDTPDDYARLSARASGGSGSGA
jgi:molybdenum cofactor cytidylyltransferase